MNPRDLRLLALASLLLLNACHTPAPHLPSDWEPKPVNTARLDDAETGRLHLFIIYSSNMCSHTALRLYSPTAGVVFWDPAGGYGSAEYPVVAKRYKDLVIDPIPSVRDYLDFRQYLPTSKMEIFEFSIPEPLAAELVDRLNTARTRNPNAYPTKTDSFRCSTKISQFLERHASQVIPVKSVFFPHDLAEQLYRIPGAKVFIYDPPELMQFLRSQPQSSGQPPVN